MTYPDIDADYPDGHTFFDEASYDAYVEESLANWNGMYDSMTEPVDDPEDADWWPPRDDHDLLEVA